MTTSATDRRIFEVELRPTVGSRIQPTGFPDIGPAVYERPVVADGKLDWQEALLVESAQSMANRLEAVGWDPVSDAPVREFVGLPWVRVVHADTGEYLTSSRTEAHRLASAFVKDATLDGQPMRDVIRDRLKLRDDRPYAPKEIAKGVMALDPLCLVHGVFFAESAKVWPGQPKVPRALTAFIEAYGVKPAHSGGVKRDHVRHQITDTGGSSEGYGTVPYHRTEWSAERIVAYIALDRAQLASYGLGDDAAELLEVVALWEVRTLFDRTLRLRTACDLESVGPLVDRAGVPLEEAEVLAERIRSKVQACAELLGSGGPIDVAWRSKKTGSSKKSKKEEGGPK
jgi:CRISPR-associated protein Csb1